MKLALIASPYDLGREHAGMGAGPIHYLEAGAADALGERGFEVNTVVVERHGAFEDETSATSEVNSLLAKHVEEAIENGAFPLVLGGNCDSALGVLSGVGASKTGIVWFDAHGDFGTPETSPDGYLGGMPLATITGHCHDELRTKIGMEAIVAESRVVMAGVRDVEREQRPLLEASEVAVAEAGQIHEEGAAKSLRAPLAELGSRVGKVYLHLDIDSLDPRCAPGVDFPAPDGLSPEEVEEAINLVAENFEIGAANLTAFDPDNDDESGKTLRLGMRLMATIAEAVGESKKKEA